MISIDGIQYRNLEEQVLKNKQDIAEFKAVERVLADFGIFIIGNLPTPEDLVGKIGEAYGNAYAIGTAPPYDYYIWTRADPNSGHTSPYWFNIGPLAIEGPRGPVGPKGPNGAEGRRGSITFIYHATQNTPPNRSQYTEVLYGDHAINLNTGEYWEYNGGGTNGWSLIGSLRGPQGPEGPQGPTGETGPIGPQGPTGPRGDPGAFIHIEGILQNAEQLPAPDVLRDLSIAYLIGTAPPYVLWMQVGTSPDDAQWNNLGEINAATFVTVNGVFQNVWSADSKLDKVAESTANGNKIYGTDQYGRTKMYGLSGGASVGTVVIRNGPGGGFNVSTSSIQSPLSVVNREYVKGYVAEQLKNALDPEGEGEVTRQEFNELKETVETLEDERPREITATYSAPDKSITFDNETSIGRATDFVTSRDKFENMFIDVEFKTSSDGVVNGRRRYKITELTKYLDYIDFDDNIIGTSYIVPALSTFYPQTYIILLNGTGEYADIILDGRLQGPGIYLGRSFKDNAQGTETYLTEVTSVIDTKYLEFLEPVEGDAEAIIDVDSLPTENIKDDVFYGIGANENYSLWYHSSGGWNRLDKTKFEILLFWDGVIGDKFVLDTSSISGVAGEYYVKFSDTVYTKDELSGGVALSNKKYIKDLALSSTEYPGAYNYGDVIVVYDANQLNTALGLPNGYVTNGTYLWGNSVSGAFIALVLVPENASAVGGKLYRHDINWQAESLNVAGDVLPISTSISVSVYSSSNAEMTIDEFINKFFAKFAEDAPTTLPTFNAFAVSTQDETEIVLPVIQIIYMDGSLVIQYAGTGGTFATGSITPSDMYTLYYNIKEA